MKPIRIYFGYCGTFYKNWDYHLCKSLNLIPTFELDLFRNINSTNGFRVRHIIWFGIFKYHWKWEIFEKGYPWKGQKVRFTNYTNI